MRTQPQVVGRRIVFGLLGLFVIAVSCARPAPSPLASGRSAAPASFDLNVRLLAAAPVERTALRALYQSGDDHLLWTDASGRLTPEALEALATLRAAADEGLDPDDYCDDLLDALSAVGESRALTPAELARVDVTLSESLLRYLHDLREGRVDPRLVGFRLEPRGEPYDYGSWLREAIGQHRLAAALDELRPPLEQYRALRAQLGRYRALLNDPAFLLPLPFTRSVHPGESYDGIEGLVRRLVALGDLDVAAASGVEPNRYSGAVVDGVRRFQARHGLDPDGVLGAQTVDALRVPIAWRLRQIELALERLRWLPPLGDERLLILNIPMFRVSAWDARTTSGPPAFGIDAIVGRALDGHTPVFTEMMREVIFRPYWNIPRSILVHEVLPKLRRDPEYLTREQMEIVRGDGDQAPIVEMNAQSLEELRAGRLRVRQRPGPSNALGLIKFVFPNNTNVYMHDTPFRTLFRKARRDFSHGCVRLADPVTLAEWVLQDGTDWTRERIEAAMAGPDNTHVRLLRPVQVVLFYATAAVRPDGSIQFAEDLYGHDAQLDTVLRGRR